MIQGRTVTRTAALRSPSTSATRLCSPSRSAHDAPNGEPTRATRSPSTHERGLAARRPAPRCAPLGAGLRAGGPGRSRSARPGAGRRCAADPPRARSRRPLRPAPRSSETTREAPPAARPRRPMPRAPDGKRSNTPLFHLVRGHPGPARSPLRRSTAHALVHRARRGPVRAGVGRHSVDSMRAIGAGELPGERAHLDALETLRARPAHRQRLARRARASRPPSPRGRAAPRP